MDSLQIIKLVDITGKLRNMQQVIAISLQYPRLIMIDSRRRNCSGYRIPVDIVVDITVDIVVEIVFDRRNCSRNCKKRGYCRRFWPNIVIAVDIAQQSSWVCRKIARRLRRY